MRACSLAPSSRSFAPAGVSKALANVNDIIGPAILGRDPEAQAALDAYMVQVLDGSKTENGWAKSKLGANAILGTAGGGPRGSAGILRAAYADGDES